MLILSSNLILSFNAFFTVFQSEFQLQFLTLILGLLGKRSGRMDNHPPKNKEKINQKKIRDKRNSVLKNVFSKNFFFNIL